MAKLRDLVRMSDQDAQDYVTRQRDMHVSTLNRDGSVQMTTNWFGLDDGLIVFNSYEASQKMVNLRRDPRITVLFASGDRYRELAGVSIRGKVRFADDPDENLRLLRLIAERNEAFVDRSVTGDATPENKAAKRICVTIEPEKVISWDHSKLPVIGQSEA